ncbi:MAG: metal-dependent hydrolase [Ectothiorhodospiraceae bacterium]|nr:metal-dependent hydrolase [Ectothiorhodospiraceae bacterium]
MDLVTQGALGAALAAAAAPRREVRVAAVVGLVGGLLPDVDALVGSADDALLVLEYHRHFTHALISVPLVALVAAALAWPLLRRRLAFARIYLYALLGCLLAGVLDAATSYGTHLWWPFHREPVAWNLVAIVDPVVTLCLLAGLGVALRRGSASPARVGLVLATLYLGLGVVQNHRATALAQALATERGHRPERMLVKPTIGNLVLWRALYVVDGRIHADAVRVLWPGGGRAYAGDSADMLGSDGAPAWAVPGSRAAHDLERFAKFSRGWLIRDPRNPDRVGDARYAMLPTSLEPLWMIAPRGPGEPVAFVTDRAFTHETRERLVTMLLGRGD